MKLNDIVRRKEEEDDIFFKIIEIVDDNKFVVKLMDGSKDGGITYILDGEELLFVRDEFDEYYNLPPVMVITHTTPEKLSDNFDKLMDKYEDFRDTKYPQYGNIKFFRDKKQIIVYVVLQ